MTKPTVKKYIEYLESAFLVIKVSTVDETCRTMQRERHFKVYLNNPSMRAALFAPVSKDDSTMIGHLAESAVFSQWQHAPAFRNLRYARWKNEGEVDVVYLHPAVAKPHWIGEVKWSYKVIKHRYVETKSVQALLTWHPSITSAFFTSKTYTDDAEMCGRPLLIQPTALYCYKVGRNITSNLEHFIPAISEAFADDPEDQFDNPVEAISSDD